MRLTRARQKKVARRGIVWAPSTVTPTRMKATRGRSLRGSLQSVEARPGRGLHHADHETATATSVARLDPTMVGCTHVISAPEGVLLSR